MCRIFNMFVMYGDTFLPNHSSYDELYYEILRQHTVFETLNQTALNYVNTSEFLWSPQKQLPENIARALYDS